MNPKNLSEYYQSQGQSLPSVAQRQGVAAQAGIQDYRGTAAQNAQLLSYLTTQGGTQAPTQSQSGTVGDAINLGNVNTNLTVPTIPTNTPVTTQTRTFTPSEYSEQGLLDQRGNLERELFNIEGSLTNQNARRNELLQQAGIDMGRVNTINQQLQAAQDREIEIPIEARQDLRGRGATVTEFQQRTTPQLENAALNALALSRQSQALGNQIAQIDQQLNVERENNTLMYQQKTQRLNQIEQLYGNILSDKQKMQLEMAKLVNTLGKEQSEFANNLANQQLKVLIDKGVDVTGITSAGDITNKYNEMINSNQIDRANSVSGTVDIMQRLMQNEQGVSLNVGTFLGRGLLNTNANAKQWRDELSQLLTNQAFQKLGEITKESSLGAISEGELALVRAAATSIQQASSGKVKLSENVFRSAMQRLEDAQKKIYIREVLGANAYTTQGIQSLSDSNKLNQIYNQTQQLLQLKATQPQAFNQVGNDTNTAVSLIKQFEGFSPTAYRDGNGYSIGYGNQTHPDGTPVKAGDRINQSQADQYLASAINSHSNWKNLIQVPLNANQQAALASFEYNLGSGIWNSGNSARGIIQAINNGNFQQAANLMQQFNKSQGTTLSALVNRRRQEGQLLLA